MSFRQPQFPWDTGVLDGRERGRTCSASNPTDQHLVRMGLGNTGGNGSDADFRHQFHGYTGIRIGIFQVENQLR